MKKKLTIGKTIYILIAIFWLLVTLFPLYFTVISSLKEDAEIWEGLVSLPREFLWGNYVSANNVANIVKSTMNSILLSIGSILIMLLCVIPASYVLARKKLRFSAAVSTYFLAALMIPIHGALVSIIQMVNMVGGQNNYFILMLVYSGINFSMACFILTGYIRELDKGIDEAAFIDGCSLFQIIARVIVPISKPAIATVSIVSFLNIYNELPIANVLLTKKGYQTISVALLAFKGDYQVKVSWIFAAIVLATIPLVVFYLFCQEYVEKGLTAGAMKG